MGWTANTVVDYAPVSEAVHRGTVSNLRVQQEVVPRYAAQERTKLHRVTACQSAGGINSVQIAHEKIPRAAQYPRVHSELEAEPGAELCVPLPRKAYVDEVPDWLKGHEKFKLLD
jgi:hypothetical protein